MAIHHTLPARMLLGAGLFVALIGASSAVESPRKSRAEAKPAAAVEPLGINELALAAGVSTGRIPCEFGQAVTVRADDKNTGYFHLQLKDQRFHLRPVESATGALRLEDKARGAVWIQLANKSMLMDQKQGRRLADECASPEQQAYAEQLKLNPVNLLDAAPQPR